MGLPAIDQIPLKNRVAAVLRKAILEGVLKPGQALTQDHLAKELNISRMPVREALTLLESDGLVVNLPYKGAVVAEFTARDIREIYQIRFVIEPFATQLAAQNIGPGELAELDRLMAAMGESLANSDQDGYAELDKRFHSLIFNASGNRRLVQLIENTWKSFPMYLAYSIPGRLQRSHQEQTRIVEALRAGDGQAASARCLEQIEAVFKEMEPHFAED